MVSRLPPLPVERKYSSILKRTRQNKQETTFSQLLSQLRHLKREWADLVRGLCSAIEKVEGCRGHASLVPDPAIAWYLSILAHIRLVAALRHLSVLYRRFHLLFFTPHCQRTAQPLQKQNVPGTLKHGA